MEKTGGHKRPLKVVVEPKRPRRWVPGELNAADVRRAAIDALIDSLMGLLPFPISAVAKFLLNLIKLRR